MERRIEATRAEHHVLLAKQHGKYHKLFQIIFSRRDGSLFVNFPYFHDPVGLLSIVTVEPGTHSRNVSLENDGMTTSHLVKYSHHPDGRVHFSQAGKVKTLVKKQSVPIRKYKGHIFTIKLQGLVGFSEAIDRDMKLAPSHARVNHFLGGEAPMDRALKFAGHWNRIDPQFETGAGVIGPTTVTIDDRGRSRFALLLSTPHGKKSSHNILTVVIEHVPLISKIDASAITFAGGFDPPEIIRDARRPTRYLSLLYPVSRDADLKKRLQSIDLPRD